MPNMAALDEMVQVVLELRATNIDKLKGLADRLEAAIKDLGMTRPGTKEDIESAKMRDVLDAFHKFRAGDFMEERKRIALDLFHKWNDVTGFVCDGTSYEGEIESIIEDAVEIGYYGHPVTNAEDWEGDDTDPGGPNAIREADRGDGE
jgi:hypothetical protein